MPSMKTANAVIEVKAANADAPNGEFTALVSVFGNVDLVGDRVMPGAFANSLAELAAAGKSLPIVWSHDWATPESYIGKALEASETEDGLLVRGAFFDTARAQTVRTLLSEKVVTEFSFAYDTVREQKAADGANELVELRILEAGPTLKGANPATQLVDAKATPAEAKAGRVLSAKNESRLREAAAALGEVLAALPETSDNAKDAPAAEQVEAATPEASPASEPEGASSRGLDPLAAMALLELPE